MRMLIYLIVESYYKKTNLAWIEEQDNSNLKKHAYQNMVVMEATKLVNSS